MTATPSIVAAPRRPIRVLELRSVRGTGGGPEKTILLGAPRSDPRRMKTTVCYIRDERDTIFDIDSRASELDVDYIEVVERHSFDPRAWSALRQVVRDRQIDIVHAHDYKTNLIAAFLAKTERIVPLATAHGWTGQSWRERFVYYPADHCLLARFPRVIAVSNEIKRTLVAAGAKADRVSTVLNGIDPEVFRRDRSRESECRAALGLRGSDVVIGSVGRLEPQKRFDLLIEAVRRLRTTRPAIRLVLVGDGSLRAGLEKQARALLPDESCLFLGHRSQIDELHHAFDVFVQSSDYEGTPNAVLEAMALETPVVATDVGGTGELMHNAVHGLIVRPGDPEALSDAVARILDDPEGTARQVAAARSRIERDLSFDARLRVVEQICEDLMDCRGGWVRAAPAQVT